MITFLYLSLINIVTAENAGFIPPVQSGQEVFHLGYKFSNYSDIIVSTKPAISCAWKPDYIDDGWKTCEAIFEVDNQNKIKIILNNPPINFVFEKENIKDQVITYSNKFDLVNETYTQTSFKEDIAGNKEPIEQTTSFVKKQFYDYTEIPLQIDTSFPFAIKISYEAPKYSENSFNFSILNPEFNTFIDPIQSACGTLNMPGIYTLDKNVSSRDTCFVISSSNVTLDCVISSITYATLSTGYGVYDNNFDNVTIKNCNITEGGSALSSYSLYFNSADKITIANNTINTLNNNGWGIYFLSSQFLTIINNTVNTLGTYGFGIYFRSSSHSELLRNNITTMGNGAYGIYLSALSGNNTFLNNYINSIDASEIQDTTGNSFVNYLVYNNDYGEIKWVDSLDNGFLKDLDINGSIGFGINLFIGNNTIALNTTAFGVNPKISSRANITLKRLGLPAVNKIWRLDNYSTDSHDIIHNGFDCTTTSCQFIGFNETSLRFSTASFSSFAGHYVPEYNLTYDANGNLIKGINYRYEYDDFNKLVRVNDTFGNIVEEYSYDHEGNRVKKINYASGGINTTTYYLDESFVRVVNSSGTYDEMYYYDDTDLVAMKTMGNLKYYHPDHLGSTNLITNGSGGVIEKITYLPFGGVFLGGNDRYLFTGKELDSVETYNFIMRNYDSFLRHFAQPDPFLNIYDPQQLNRYAYARNNPYKYVDESGGVIALVPLAIGAFPYVWKGIGIISTILTFMDYPSNAEAIASYGATAVGEVGFLFGTSKLMYGGQIAGAAISTKNAGYNIYSKYNTPSTFIPTIIGLSYDPQQIWSYGGYSGTQQIGQQQKEVITVPLPFAPSDVKEITGSETESNYDSEDQYLDYYTGKKASEKAAKKGSTNPWLVEYYKEQYENVWG
ncbi:MAG TPA: RHS repeat-associated core domain-containing protein [Candidatus Nanoarchaeia archaeon]|nr:RHS repeat-associated core domain-containing protein [Candidatus Nanoarchaeia archaeon]